MEQSEESVSSFFKVMSHFRHSVHITEKIILAIEKFNFAAAI